ncbi:hypothetical protein RFI_11571 [Reticulomyxa filosa]|uniref:Uncharacterized protein n=1 Tax=Reticulomyxa filosa TaxID=46433 RepID=X6NGX5_RETFI|nr:hypothetical protein RFI_11571 [Reticulomyxa filosa]|eukprot:ETO25570.1 hypothetical protein RFI_11571 [Reticulomyxa filosa]
MSPLDLVREVFEKPQSLEEVDSQLMNKLISGNNSNNGAATVNKLDAEIIEFEAHDCECTNKNADSGGNNNPITTIDDNDNNNNSNGVQKCKICEKRVTSSLVKKYAEVVKKQQLEIATMNIKLKTQEMQKEALADKNQALEQKLGGVK